MTITVLDFRCLQCYLWLGLEDLSSLQKFSILETDNFVNYTPFFLLNLYTLSDLLIGTYKMSPGILK